VSPRRKIDPATDDLLVESPARPRRRWGFAVIAALAALLISGAIATSTVMTLAHESRHRNAIHEADVLGYVRAFMTGYTSPDPYHANDYTDRVMAQAAGDFAKSFKEKKNEIAVRVAMSQPTQGAVLDAGVEKWNSDGSATILVATKITTTTPDGKSPVENANRWVLTVIKEGQISQLMQVI
jgi:Mce-associated membrane protein